MTLPGNRIGDKGQRYEIRYIDEDGDERVFGWAGTVNGAQEMARAARLMPGTLRARYVDRRPGEPPGPVGGRQDSRRTRAP